jgi:hypothetical protein
MAANDAGSLTKRQYTKHADAISTALIIKKVQGHTLNDEPMSVTQLRGAEILLNRTMPTLRATDVTSDGGPLSVVLGSFVQPVD